MSREFDVPNPSSSLTFESRSRPRPNTTPTPFGLSFTKSKPNTASRIVRGVDSSSSNQMQLLSPQPTVSTIGVTNYNNDSDDDSVVIDEEVESCLSSPNGSSSDLKKVSLKESSDEGVQIKSKSPKKSVKEGKGQSAPLEKKNSSSKNGKEKSPIDKMPPGQLREVRRPQTTLQRSRINIGKKELIGKGSFGVVFRAIDLDSNRIIAVKEIAVVPGSHGKKQLVSLRKEISLMQRLSHPNIVKYFGEHFDGENTLHIYMEYVPGGSISSLIRCFGALQESQCSRFTRQLLCGLQYLHGCKIAHRDLKGDNLLVDVDGNVKLADFGTAKEIATMETHSVAGTAAFMAPEVVKGGMYGVEADVWSVGCTVIEMLSGKPPFSDGMHAANQFAIMLKVAESSDDAIPIPQNITPEAKDFLLLCLKHDPAKRASCDDLLSHPWILHPPNPVDVKVSMRPSDSAEDSVKVKTISQSTYNPVQSFDDDDDL